MNGAADPNDPAEVATLLRMLRRTAAEVECVVQGGSMGTAIPDGASVRVQLDGGASAQPEAAVALLLGGDTFSVHRLIKRGRSPNARGFVITHGDGNIFCDAPHREAELLGTVVAFRPTGQTEWGPVPPSARRGLRRRTVTPAFERLMCAALELHPRLATAVKNALVLAMTPLLWFRPYEAGRGRSTSRLVGSHPVAPR